MANKAALMAIPFLFFVPLIAFQNCSKVDFSTPVSSLSSDDETIEDVIANCEEAGSRGLLKTMTQQIVFADSTAQTGSVCQWNSGDNLPERNGFVQSRIEERKSIQLPAGATICDATFQFKTGPFKYDDFFFFTINDHVVATDASWAKDHFETSRMDLASAGFVTLSAWNWSKIAGLDSADNNTSSAYNYCIGAAEGLSSCSWPATEQTGTIRMDFDPRLVAALTFQHAKTSSIDFSFITTGDNDPNKDCRHGEVSFTTTVKYIN
jgi:hypothetical protein